MAAVAWTSAHKVAIFKGLFTGLTNVYGTYDLCTGKVRQVKATVTDRVKGEKVRIFKYTGKRYRRRLGHRQQYTRLHIDEIVV